MLFVNIVENSSVKCVFLFYCVGNEYCFCCIVLYVRVSEVYKVNVDFVKFDVVVYFSFDVFYYWFKLKVMWVLKREKFCNYRFVGGVFIKYFIVSVFFLFYVIILCICGKWDK